MLAVMIIIFLYFKVLPINIDYYIKEFLNRQIYIPNEILLYILKINKK